MINKFKGLVESYDHKNYSKDVYSDFVLNYNYITESLKSKKIKINIDSEKLHKNRLDKSNSFIVLFVGSCFYLFFLFFVILHFIISGFSDFIYSLLDWELQKIPFAYLIFLGLKDFCTLQLICSVIDIPRKCFTNISLLNFQDT